MEVFNKALASPDYGEYHVDHPTAQQIVDREDLTGKLTDKVMLITGATSGVGVETARVLHLTGAHLFLAIRDMAKGEQVKRDIETSSGQGKGKIDLPHVDLESLDSVRQCAADFLSKSKQLNVLVCNAGVLGPPNVRTTDGLETTFGVNHVAHFLLFQLLKAALLSSSTPSFNSRVVMLSSTGHQFSPVLIDDLDLSKHGYSVMVAYGSSKTANVYMALEIDRRYGSRNLHSTALHPGSVPSLLGRHLDTAHDTAPADRGAHQKHDDRRPGRRHHSVGRRQPRLGGQGRQVPGGRRCVQAEGGVHGGQHGLCGPYLRH